jgi:hypothetical protein
LSGTQHFNLIACSPGASGSSVKRLIISMIHGEACCQMQQASPLNQLCVITLGAACLSSCRLVCLPAMRCGQKKCPNSGRPSKSASLGQKKGRNPGRATETSVFVSAVSCRRSIGNKVLKPKSRPTCHSLRTMAFGLPSGTALRTSEQAIPQQNASNANQPALRFRKPMSWPTCFTLRVIAEILTVCYNCQLEP